MDHKKRADYGMRYLESKIYDSWIMLNNQCVSKRN